MINLKVHTEYSFRYTYGKIKDIISSAKDVACITDRHTTFGHIPFYKECKKQGKKCILGVELAFVNNAGLKVRQTTYYVTLLAINSKGLTRIYELTSKASSQKYYHARLSFTDLRMINENDVVIIFENSMLSGYLGGRSNTYYGVSPMTIYNDYLKIKGQFPIVAISNNLYHKPFDKNLYQIILGRNSYEDRTELSHILNEEEWRQEVYYLEDKEKEKAIKNTESINGQIQDVEFKRAELPKQDNSQMTLRDLCIEGCKKRGIDLTDKVYCKRINKEIDLIEQKNYTEYFFLTKDLVDYAKQHMLVGPGRGSAAGSLVCYLLGITEVDPLKFGLIFERFIDINRDDLPDIDIDFPNNKVDMCMPYLQEKYGKDCVAYLSTIAKYKPKSILTEISKVLEIPIWEIKEFKNNIIERKPGDKRASKTLEDAFVETEIGQKYLEKFPNLIYSQYIEGHSRHISKHAAAIVVAGKSIHNFCSVDLKTNRAMIDKIDAEKVNLLKMDCLSLRTLMVIQECLDLIGKDRDWIVNYRLDDKKVFDVINNRRFSGIFQFEGNALKAVSKRIKIKSFQDIAAITAIARPGPMSSGGTENFIKAKNGKYTKVLPGCEEITKETCGVMIYQEQLMRIVREVGKMSWKDTTILRKAMAKSYGEEFFEDYYEKFKAGCKENGLNIKEINIVWDSIKGMGKYAFNKAHSVSYAMVSYWCMVLKCYHPLDFALATLKNAKSDDQVMQILKELDAEGYKYKIFDKELSEVDWCIKDNVLIGGFINLKGVGEKKAVTLIDKRKTGKSLTVSERKKLFDAITPYDSLFDFRDNFKIFYDNWNLFMNKEPVYLEDIEGRGQTVRFIAKTTDIKLRDVNETVQVKKRKGQIIRGGCLNFLDLKFQDDTDVISGRINREIYLKFGKKIFEKDNEGDYYLVKGRCCNGFRYIIIKNIRKITLEEIEEKLKKT